MLLPRTLWASPRTPVPPAQLGCSLRAYSVAADAPVPRKRKVWDSVDEAIKDVKTGDVLLSGGGSHAGSSAAHMTLTIACDAQGSACVARPIR